MRKGIVLILLASLCFMLCSCLEKSEAEQAPEALRTEEAEKELPPEEEQEGPSGEAPSLSFGLSAPAEKLTTVRLTVTQDTNAVSKDEKFGAALLSLSQEEFEAIGFRLGDSCNIAFDNGYELADVPYYNGYYVRNGCPVMVAYPGDPFVRITLNNEGIWEAAGLSSGSFVTITLSEAGKYSAVQEALGQQYSFDRADYSSDEEFVNFRALSGGKLKSGFLFRGASPVDNSRGRAAYTDALLKENGILFILDLADSEEDIQSYFSASDFNSPYANGLIEGGSVSLLDMGSAYTSEAYQKKLAQGLSEAILCDGPWYIHCMEGKDRTGFVCLLLEALAGANYNELMNDYMITYRNYFAVSSSETPDKFDAIVDLYFVPFLEFLHGTDDLSVLKSADFTEDAKNYLRSGGMSEGDIAALTACITE